MKPTIEFTPWPKIARWNREVVVTEKLDGTNASIYINDTGDELYTGSRTRWIEPGDDNMGFAAWAQANRDELLKLGPGTHYGEWWGKGIQKRYGDSMSEKRFSLFNVGRWTDENKPACCHVVPTLWKGTLEEFLTPVFMGSSDLESPLERVMGRLETEGSVAAPGCMRPEGIIVFHTKAGIMFKKTLDKDDAHKGEG